MMHGHLYSAHPLILTRLAEVQILIDFANTYYSLPFLGTLVVELACGEYGMDSIKKMVDSMLNGECIEWFSNPNKVLKLETLRKKYPITQTSTDNGLLESTTPYRQLEILMRRGWIKAKRDATLTHLR